MPDVKLPSNVSSITVSGSTHTPDTKSRVQPVNDTLATAMNHWDSRPKLRKSAANGDLTIVLHSVITSITIAGTVYTPNAAGEIVVPAIPGTAFLNECKYVP